MSGQPDSGITDDDWLIRRILPNGWYGATGLPKPTAFKLRVLQKERGLSFYLLSACPAELLLDAAPAGSGVVRIRAGNLRERGFTVALEPDPEDAVKGDAHVAVYPPALDEEGQISLEILAGLPFLAEWAIAPAR